mmetsp:Transcript_73561/g.238008  ORF Transcript_73561/g.238008 Transcript_73561/m.238008 type:complete len:227 (+) Transcript_73561:1315-1995(+)
MESRQQLPARHHRRAVASATVASRLGAHGSTRLPDSRQPTGAFPSGRAPVAHRGTARESRPGHGQPARLSPLGLGLARPQPRLSSAPPHRAAAIFPRGPPRLQAPSPAPQARGLCFRRPRQGARHNPGPAARATEARPGKPPRERRYFPRRSGRSPPRPETSCQQIQARACLAAFAEPGCHSSERIMPTPDVLRQVRCSVQCLQPMLVLLRHQRMLVTISLHDPAH